jgi:hypothetical protein
MGRAKGDDRGSKKRWRSTSEIIGQFLVVVVAHALFLGSRRMSGGLAMQTAGVFLPLLKPARYKGAPTAAQ